jgi:hypothetical protein
VTASTILAWWLVFALPVFARAAYLASEHRPRAWLWMANFIASGLLAIELMTTTAAQ